jgi:hypothetical protein
MTTVRITRFALAAGTTEDALLRERSRLVDHVRDHHSGLTATELVRLDDGRWQDTWSWSSPAERRRVMDAVSTFPPQVRTVFTCISDVEVVDGSEVDGLRILQGRSESS